MPPYSLSAASTVGNHGSSKTSISCLHMTKSNRNENSSHNTACRDPVDSCHPPAVPEERCTTTTTKPNPQKKVRFAEYASFHIYRRRCVEGTSTWYNQEDLNAFRMDTIATIHRIVAGDVHASNTNGIVITSEYYCSRGCEGRTPLGNMVRQKHRNDSLKAVFQYQDQCRRQLRLKRCRTSIITPANPSKDNIAATANHQHTTKQRTLRLTDVMDPDKLGEMYAKATQQSRQAAQFVGQMDRWTASRVLDDNPTDIEGNHQPACR
jgi:hypothetical protein